MNKYRKIKETIFLKIKDEKIPFNNKIFVWFLSVIFFNFFFKKKIANDAAYFDYLFTNNMLKDHSLLSDMVAKVGWISFKEKSWSSSLNYDLPDNDIPNQQFFSQSRQMQGIADTGFTNTGSDLLSIDKYKNKSVFSQQGSFVPIFYKTNPLEDSQFIEKSSSFFRLHWTSYIISLLIYILEVVLLFCILFFSLDFYIYFDGFCWSIFKISNQYPSRFIWLNLVLGSYSINIYDILPGFFKILILFIWHIWAYSKFMFFTFIFVFINFFFVFLTFTTSLMYNIYLKMQNLSTEPSSDGYFGDFSQYDFLENAPEFTTRGGSMYRASANNNLSSDTPHGDVTRLTKGHIKNDQLSEDFFVFYKDKKSVLKMRPLSEFFFFFKSFILIFIMFFWNIILFVFLLFTINYFCFSFFRFFLYNDVYKYTIFNYFFGHINLFPLLDWFYQFEIKLKKIYNQRFFLEKYTNYIFSKGFSKMHYFFINKDEKNSLKLKYFFNEINSHNKDILFPRRMKSKRYFYRSLIPHIPDIDKYFKNGTASKRLLFDFVFFKHYTSFENKIVFLATKDNVNYYIPNKSRLWIVNGRFKDFYTYMYDLFTGSFFFSYIQFTNFKFSSLDDLTISRLLQLSPQDDNLYNEKHKKYVIYSNFLDIPVTKASCLMRTHNRKKIVSDIFLESFICTGSFEKPEVFYNKKFYNQNFFSIKKFINQYYNYIFFHKDGFKKDHYNNLFRLNFKFEELFESLEHESDLFFDFSKRNVNASDIDTYLKNYWTQYTTLRDYKVKKIKSTMKLNNFFVRSRLKFLKIFSNFEVGGGSFFFDKGGSFLYDKVEDRKLYESFKYYNVKYLKKFLRMYGLFQFNSFLRNNKYLIISNFLKNYDLVKLKYFKNLELWKIFQFRTPFQTVFNRLNTRSLLGYYCNSNNTFPFIEYRDHFKSHVPSEPSTWIISNFIEERHGFAEGVMSPEQRTNRFSFDFQRKVTPLNYVFYFENDTWRNYKYNLKQKFLDSSPKFAVSSGFFSSYYFIVKYLPKEMFKNKDFVNFYFYNNIIEYNYFTRFSNILIEFLFLFKNKVHFIFVVWQWLFFFFVIFIFSKILDDSSFVYSKSKYFYKNPRDYIIILNFLISFFFFLLLVFFVLFFFFGFVKFINYFSGNYIYIIYTDVFNFLIEKLKHLKISNFEGFKMTYFKYVIFFSYIFICSIIYAFILNNFLFTYSSKKNYLNNIFIDFTIKKLSFLKNLTVKKSFKEEKENKIYASIDQISFFKTYETKKKKNLKKKQLK